MNNAARLFALLTLVTVTGCERYTEQSANCFEPETVSRNALSFAASPEQAPTQANDCSFEPLPRPE